MTYKVFVEEAAVESILASRGQIRRNLRTFLGQLANDPFNEGDFEEFDLVGRQTFTKVLGEIAISYYPDHAVREIKVFQIIPADE